MQPETVFTITYWGTTGTLSAPPRPPEITDKLVRSIVRLADLGQLQSLRPGAGLEADVRRLVEGLPFHLRAGYGGNTTCVEVQTPDALIILDCGSGFRELGHHLAGHWAHDGRPKHTAHVLVTHAHMDHTYGTPFFMPYYNPANSFTLWGSRSALDSLQAVLDPKASLSHVYFPPTFDELKAIRSFQEVKGGDEFHIGGTRITTCALHHPGGCLGYRLENAGRVFVFATDHEQQQVPDPVLCDFARDADLLYTEGQYTRDEYEGRVGPAGDPPIPRRGWGHSPVDACVATAVAAGVRVLHVGHREPRRNDEQLAEIDGLIQRLMREELERQGKPANACRAVLPHEGLTVRL
jgi:phosphoribosyl 1,2-cyclic phosphodiesterase